MKFSCPRKEFFEAVNAAAQAVSNRSPIATLQSIKIVADSTGLTVTGCDGEMWIVRRANAVVEVPGAICLPARTFTQVLAQMGDADVSITAENHGIAEMVQGDAEHRFPTINAEDFPDVPVFMGEREINLSLGEFRRAVASVAYACSDDKHRQALTGVHFRYSDDVLTLVSTDTHRLAVRRVHRPGLGEPLSVTVPEKALKAIRNLPHPDDSDITLSLDTQRLAVDTSNATVVTQLLAAPFPAWEKVVPSTTTRAWTLEADTLFDTAKRCIIVSGDNRQIRLKGSDNQLVVSARSADRGESKEVLPIIAQNGDIELAFNGKFLLDFLNSVSDPGVRIEMTESIKPVIFRPVEDEDYFCVIMPMSLN
ncbi:MAG: DNA polymerase III subunit beta [Fimbriimonadaceae bacterium]|nr:DNA polymerase III subunit beta [Fimbriimonadaceae bacterium]